MELTDEVRANRGLYVMYENGNLIKERMLAGYRTAAANGVKIGVGTDAGIVSHGSVWKEMTYFVEFGGVSPGLALHLGTLGTAESIGIADITGSVEQGKFADFVIVDADPFADLSTLATPRLVVAAGVVVEPR
jgi:imidazolonepropionase-like amidohydrolase